MGGSITVQSEMGKPKKPGKKPGRYVSMAFSCCFEWPQYASNRHCSHQKYSEFSSDRQAYSSLIAECELWSDMLADRRHGPVTEIRVHTDQPDSDFLAID